MGVPRPPQFQFERLPLGLIEHQAFNGTWYREGLPAGLRQVTAWRRAGEPIHSQHGWGSVLSWLQAEARRINKVNPRREAVVVRELVRPHRPAETRVALFAVEPWRVG